MRKLFYLALLILVIGLCTAFISRLSGEEPVKVLPSKQRVGNAVKGFDYLVNGDYVKSGIPLKVFLMGMGKADHTYLNRDSINKDLPFSYTAIHVNGQVLAAPNCLQCHAQVYGDQLIIGLGNAAIDFSSSQKLNPQAIGMLGNYLQKTSQQQYEAALPFLHATQAITPFLFADTRGVNTADRLAALLVAHRDPVSFQWSDKALLDIPEEVIPSDTPPWWLLKKKNAMFYNGFGRGDFGRFLMASNLLTVKDTSESRAVDEHMPDVLAYIYSLKPPVYPGKINKTLAKQGQKIFEEGCSSCHGSYGKKPEYPNLLIPEQIIGTDSLLYKNNYSHPQFVNWFNKSWFTQGDHPARLEPFNGYMAPPLDGIWITAPYLHNGSVPTLEALLNSKLRPTYWTRDFDHPELNETSVGWNYTLKDGKGKGFYNTTLPGYGNYGHTFGDALSDDQRRALIEYLKTL